TRPGGRRCRRRRTWLAPGVGREYDTIDPTGEGRGMAKKRKPVVGMRRTREHVIADLAVNHVERQALLAGFVIERTRADYGIGLMMLTFDTVGELEDGHVHVQVKGTEALSWLRGKKAAAFRIERRHLVTWLKQSLPVILVVYDAGDDHAYWIHVQGYFSGLRGFNLFLAGEAITVQVPDANILNMEAIRHFAALRDQARRSVPQR
ncbi:MAG: DUF4365 domain-containing protein, partial [Gemmataceae bacterium]|nr:DUF4365 domain-containing protein [Gemmataceae bacterium]